MSTDGLLDAAIADLCERFDKNGYNPTPIIDLGVLVANADGVVDEAEVTALRGIFQRLLGEQIDAELVGHLVDASREVIDAAGVGPRLRLLAEILQDCDAVEQGITVALGVAYASEGLSASERTLVSELAGAAGLPDGRLEELIESVRAQSERET